MSHSSWIWGAIFRRSQALLHQRKDLQLPWGQRLQVALDVAKADGESRHGESRFAALEKEGFTCKIGD